MVLSKSQLEKVTKLIYKHTGIQLSEDKRIMITNRINKLFQKHIEFDGGIDKFLTIVEKEYLSEFISVFTTNKTNFFREIQHFHFLYEEVFPIFNKENKSIKIYCSASSTGEEVWSVLGTYLARKKKDNKVISQNGIDFLATDIDTSILKQAKTGDYECRDVSKQDLPEWLEKDIMFELPSNKCRKASSTYDEYSQVKIKKELLQMVKFKQMNLMDHIYKDVKDNFYDVVFCRNVLIYFSKEDQEKILKRLLKKVKVGGYLMLGHSEAPLGIKNDVEKKSHNIFLKKR